jgi:hypothetical protein
MPMANLPRFAKISHIILASGYIDKHPASFKQAFERPISHQNAQAFPDKLPAFQQDHNVSKSLTIPVIAVTAALAFMFNPSAEQHREKIKSAISERSQIERVLGIGQLTSFISQYHSLGLASYTTVNKEITSVGALGKVIVLD